MGLTAVIWEELELVDLKTRTQTRVVLPQTLQGEPGEELHDSVVPTGKDVEKLRSQLDGTSWRPAISGRRAYPNDACSGSRFESYDRARRSSGAITMRFDAAGFEVDSSEGDKLVLRSIDAQNKMVERTLAWPFAAPGVDGKRRRCGDIVALELAVLLPATRQIWMVPQILLNHQCDETDSTLRRARAVKIPADLPLRLP